MGQITNQHHGRAWGNELYCSGLRRRSIVAEYTSQHIFLGLLTETKIILFFSDSDDSDNEGGLGNVERVVMRPPGHSGKAKKGHLCFDAIYETGI